MNVRTWVTKMKWLQTHWTYPWWRTHQPCHSSPHCQRPGSYHETNVDNSYAASPSSSRWWRWRQWPWQWYRQQTHPRQSPRQCRTSVQDSQSQEMSKRGWNVAMRITPSFSTSMSLLQRSMERSPALTIGSWTTASMATIVLAKSLMWNSIRTVMTSRNLTSGSKLTVAVKNRKQPGIHRDPAHPILIWSVSQRLLDCEVVHIHRIKT
jgi:hypothetical protein